MDVALTIKLKSKLNKFWDKIKNVDLSHFTGVFITLILLSFHVNVWQSLSVGILGYLLYLRLEESIIKIVLIKK
jgi:hypothetical protein